MGADKRHEDEQQGIGRRTLVRWFLGVGALSSLASMASVLGTVQPAGEGTTSEIKKGDRLLFATGSNKGDPVTSTSIVPGQATLVFPEDKEVQQNLIMVFHFHEQDLKKPTNLNWTPHGFVAYSAICTHLGCTVNFSHEGMEGAPFPHIHCPCHAAIFKPQAGAQVIGGPAPRPLPQLPLTINANNELVAAGPFEAPVGVL